jgi:hypothetical protein
MASLYIEFDQHFSLACRFSLWYLNSRFQLTFNFIEFMEVLSWQVRVRFVEKGN